MNTYLTNMANYCFGFNCPNGSSEDITIRENISLVRDSDGEVVDGYIPLGVTGAYKEGETYTAKRYWALTKGYNLIARFDCKEKAEAELKRIVEELKNDSKVIVVKSNIK